MNENAFDEIVESIGPISVLRATKWYSNYYLLIKASCVDGNSDSQAAVIKLLTDLQIMLYIPISVNTSFNFKAKRVRLPGTKKVVIEFLLFLYGINDKLNDIVNWLRNNANNLPVIQQHLDDEKLSVGPSMFLDTKLNAKYVKVRFDGASVPFYFDDYSKIWLKDLTEQSIRELKEFGPTLIETILNILIQNKDTILERALLRPLNLSNISEYGEHVMKYYKKVAADEWIMIDTSKSLANPNVEMAIVFMYSGTDRTSKYFALIEDNIYKISTFYNKSWSGYNKSAGKSWYRQAHQGHIPEEVKFVNTDLTPIDPSDQYVRERIARAMKAKL